MADVATDAPAGRTTIQEWDPAILGRVPTKIVDLFGYRFRIFEHEHISRKIEENAVYEAAPTRLLPAVLGYGGDFLDVGAHFGYYTLWLARLSAGRGSIHAFEPNPLPFALLEENVRANGVTNVHLNNVAVSKESETAMIDLGLTLPDASENGPEYNSGVWSLARKGSGPHPLRIVSVDEYVEERRLTSVRFMKVEVEGHERQVLQGAAETLRTMRPVLLMEFNAQNERRRQAAMHVFDFLRTRKYNLAVVVNRPFPHLRRLHEDDMGGATFRFHAFAIRGDLTFLGE